MALWGLSTFQSPLEKFYVRNFCIEIFILGASDQVFKNFTLVTFRREKERAVLQEQAEKRAAKILGKSKPQFYEQKDGVEFVSREGWTDSKKKSAAARKNLSLGELLQRKNEEGEIKIKNGVHEVRFLKPALFFMGSVA